MNNRNWENADPNSIIPENAPPDIAAFDTKHMHMTSESQKKLTPDQMDWLIKRLSTDDQEQLGKVLKDCTFEMTMTRGLPFAALVTGSMYFARTRLPEQYRFGPKGWPFYALMGFGAMTAANLLSMNKCGERVKPKIWELYHKYQSNTNLPPNATNYDALRAKNRQNLSLQPDNSQSSLYPYPPQDRSTSDPYQTPLNESQQRSGFLYEDQPSVMSGTPTSSYEKGFLDESSQGGNRDKGY